MNWIFISQPKHILWVLKRTVSSWVSCSDHKRHRCPISHIVLIDNVINIKCMWSKLFFFLFFVFFSIWNAALRKISEFPVAAYAVWKLLNEMKMLHTDHAEFDYFYVPSTIFQLCRDGSSWVEPVLLKLGLMCLVQWHNAVTPVRLEPQPFGLKPSTLPLSHCAPTADFYRVIFFECSSTFWVRKASFE